MTRPLHVERSDDPTVLRWVTHDPAIGNSPNGYRRPPPQSPLGALVAANEVDEIVVVGADLLVTVGSESTWGPVAPKFRAALLAELDALDELATRGGAGQPGHWLVTTVEGQSVPTPGIAAVQHIVDRVAGPLAGQHGGSLTVTAVEADRVILAAGGACHGCSQSTTTVMGLIEPAVRAAFPMIDTISLESGDGTKPAEVQFLGSNSRRTIGS